MHGDLMTSAGSTAGEIAERSRRVTAAMAALGIALAVAALVLVLVNIQVAAGPGMSRSCGSAFDGAVDRSGWELWWAHDLDEPDDQVRSLLPRTTECPGAVNRQLAVSGLMGALGASILFVAATRHRRHTIGPAAPAESRVARLGQVTMAVGAVLTAGGVAAIVALVADADSTLFLYVDRTVVALVGFIVLVPTLALVVIGRALMLLAPRVSALEDRRLDPTQNADGR